MFLKPRQREAQIEKAYLGFKIEDTNPGEVQEIIDLPIQRSITRINGVYFYNLGSNLKKLSKEELDLAARTKAATIASILKEVENDEAFEPNQKYFEKAKEDALNYLKSLLPYERASYISYLIAVDTIGYGPISLLLEDKKNIEEIEINSPNSNINIYTTKYGRCKTNLLYTSEEEFRRSINKLLYLVEKELSTTNPVIDAEIGDVRVHTQMKPYAHSGAIASIRVGGKKELNVKTLIANNTLSPSILAYIWLALDAGLNIIIAGAPASGKTTLLASLIPLIPRYKKIVAIEDEANELWPFLGNNAVALYSSKMGISQQQQIINALRIRPDRLIVGEIRGEEAKEIFSGANLGVPFITTMHSNEDGLAIVKRLMVKPMGVEPASLGMLDVAIYMKQLDISRRSVDSVFEYKWLSRGETDDGMEVGGVDKVRIDEVVKNSKIDPEKLRDSKVVRVLSRENGLTYKKVLEELRKREKFLLEISGMPDEKIKEMVDIYGVHAK